MKHALALIAGLLAAAARPADMDELHRLVDEVYNRLTPEERAAQICATTAGNLCGKDGKFDHAKAAARFPHGIGHVCQFACNRTDKPEALVEFVNAVQKYFVEDSSSHIPAICHEEVISGLAARTATTYPQQIGIAATWNPELMRRKCRETSEAMQSVGCAFALSPMADVIYNSNWTRLEEGYGESGYLAAVMGTAFVQGLQESGKTAACTKHFLGYGTIGGGQNRPWRDIYEEVVLPHEAMIRAGGAAAVMTSYDQFKGEQAVSNSTLVKDILRGYIGFDGTVVSDYGAVAWGVKGVADPAEKKELQRRRAAEALKAGNDIDLPHGECYSFALDLVRDGLVTEEEFAAAVKNALLLKARTGLLGAKCKELSPEELDRPEWRATARRLAEESIVLLKNDGILPLAPSAQIALVGPNANSPWAMLGDYTYQCMQAFWRRNPREWDEPHIVTLKEGLEALAGKDSVVYERGCDWSKSGDALVSAGGDPRTAGLSLKLAESADRADFDAAVAAGRGADVVVCAMGENFTLCGESRQRASIRLAGDQEKLVRAMIATGRPVVLVMFNGRNEVLPQDIVEGCAAIVQAWYPGEEGGSAVASVLCGTVNPSGKLPVSYPRTENREDVTFGDGTDTPERVMWPFGFGLSYTTFEYSGIRLADGPAASTADETVGVAFTLENAGERDGVEIAQVYVTSKGSPARLRGFARVELKKGECKRVAVRLPLESFARWEGGKDGEWVLSPGEYEIRVGASAWDVKASLPLTLAGGEVRFPVRNVFFASVEEHPTLKVQEMIDAAAVRGGGTVAIPAGTWRTGALHLRSNVELHLDEGAQLVFGEDLADYLPAVRSSWEGIECMGYSPLVYAYGCTNIAVTGKGVLRAEVENRWRGWGLARKKNPLHDKAKRTLSGWSRAQTPVEERRFHALEQSLMRPQFIMFNRCRDVRVEGLKIRNSPFWTIHLLCCENAVLRGLDIFADCKNSDGLDVESSRNVLVEDCIFEQGDDAIAIKSGINHEGRRRAMPSEDVTIRRCTVNEGHSMLSIGSELSGGIRRIVMEDCRAESDVDKVFFIKTNPERGGFVEDVRVSRIRAKGVRHPVVSAIADYFWKPGSVCADGIERATRVQDILLEDIQVETAPQIYSFRGCEGEPIRRLTLRDVRAASVAKPSEAVFVEFAAR